MKSDEEIVKGGPCALCEETCLAEMYCYGCNEFICEGCEQAFYLMGPHDAEDHLTPYEDPAEEDAEEDGSENEEDCG